MTTKSAGGVGVGGSAGGSGKGDGVTVEVGGLVGADVGVGEAVVGVGEGEGVGVRVGGLAVGVAVKVGCGVVQLTGSAGGVGDRSVIASRSGLNATNKTAVIQAKPMTTISPSTKY